MCINGNISSDGITFRMEAARKETLVIPVNDYEIISASKIKSAHTSFWYYAVCNICHHTFNFNSFFFS